jgi:hypothetical protein
LILAEGDEITVGIESTVLLANDRLAMERLVTLASSASVADVKLPW